MSILLLEQPRRGKTREAQVTPHMRRRSAVWGIATPGDASVSETHHYNQKSRHSPPKPHWHLIKTPYRDTVHSRRFPFGHQLYHTKGLLVAVWIQRDYDLR